MAKQSIKKKNQRSKYLLGTFIKGSLTVLISVLFIYGVVQASTIKITPPSGTPVATFYSLSEIYNFITANTAATLASPALDFSSALEDTGNTLTEIYSVLASLISADKVKLDTTYLNTAGSLVPTSDGGTAAVADLFLDKTAQLTADWTLDTGTLKLACATSTFDGTSNLVATAYDGDGDGTNRWCMATSAASASAGDIVLYKSAWVNGQEIAGSFASSTATATTEGEEITPSAGTWLSKVTVAITNLIASVIKSGETVGGVVGELLPSSGTATTTDVCSTKTYYGANQTDWNLATGVLTIDAAKIATTTSYCGVSGTLLGNLWNGTRTDGGFPGGSQDDGGVDDYNNADPAADDRYSKGWTSCATGDYCGTGLASADAKDDSTGLIWSLPCNGAGCDSFSDSAPATYNWSADGADADNWSTVQNATSTASGLCANGDHQESGWHLPTQKQLMQAYIDGSYGNLEASGVNRSYWSGTTKSWYTTYAWITNLSHGNTTTFYVKSSSSDYVRCVRSAN